MTHLAREQNTRQCRGKRWSMDKGSKNGPKWSSSRQNAAAKAARTAARENGVRCQQFGRADQFLK